MSLSNTPEFLTHQGVWRGHMLSQFHFIVQENTPICINMYKVKYESLNFRQFDLLL